MKQWILAILITGGIGFTSCNDDNNNNGDGNRTRITLSSQVELGNAPRIQDLQIAAGQTLSFFVTGAASSDNETVYYDNQEIIANGTGGFTYEETMYYPTDGSNVDFFAMHPYAPSASLTDNYTFTLAADQTDRTGYLNSDLLYATRADVARTTGSVSMLFSHKLSKLDFVIIQGEGADISGLNTVTALNVAPTVSLDLTSGGLSEATGTGVEVTTYGLTTPTEGETEVSGITAIITPQTFAAGQRLFRIRLGSIDYYYTTESAITFQPGYRYTLALTINQAGIQLESSIAPWTEGGTISGEGNIE